MPRGSLWLFTNFRGVPEGNGEEQGGNGQSQNQDVSEALHGGSRGEGQGAGGQVRGVPAGGT